MASCDTHTPRKHCHLPRGRHLLLRRPVCSGNSGHRNQRTGPLGIDLSFSLRWPSTLTSSDHTLRTPKAAGPAGEAVCLTLHGREQRNLPRMGKRYQRISNTWAGSQLAQIKPCGPSLLQLMSWPSFVLMTVSHSHILHLTQKCLPRAWSILSCPGSIAKSLPSWEGIFRI